MSAVTAKTDCLFVRHDQALLKISFNDIKFFEAEGNYCTVRTKDGLLFTSKTSLRQLIKRLPSDTFIRIHKRYIININELSSIVTKDRIVKIGEEVLPFGRTYIKDLTDRIMIYVMSGCTSVEPRI